MRMAGPELDTMVADETDPDHEAIADKREALRAALRQSRVAYLLARQKTVSQAAEDEFQEAWDAMQAAFDEKHGLTEWVENIAQAERDFDDFVAVYGNDYNEDEGE
jgi:hypothetical protein